MKFADLKKAHEFTMHNKSLVEESNIAGCLHCKSIFSASEVEEYEFDGIGKDTAICPKCGIDSVLPDKAGYEINSEMLEELHNEWFTGGWKLGHTQIDQHKSEMWIKTDYLSERRKELPSSLLSVELTLSPIAKLAPDNLRTYDDLIEIAVQEITGARKMAVVAYKGLFRTLYFYIKPEDKEAIYSGIKAELPQDVGLSLKIEDDDKHEILGKMFISNH